MRFEPPLNATPRFDGEAQVSAYAANAQRMSMMERGYNDALTVAPPVYTRITTALARHCSTRELEHVVKRCNLRLVGDFKERGLLVWLGMAEPSPVAYDDTVNSRDGRPEILVDQKAEKSRG